MGSASTAEYEHVEHPFDPVYDGQSRILILGSLPSVKSREQQFYYGHPMNRFWKVLAEVLQTEVPQTVSKKKEMLLSHHIAIWDVIRSCDIRGSSDSSIRNAKPTDVGSLLSQTQIARIYANGATAAKLYQRYQQESTGIDIITLPSTSPANAAFSLEKLVKIWGEALK